jgi:hypothetical protein
MVLGCEVELQPCFAGQLHFCPEQHSARRVGAFDLPEVDDIAGFDTGRSWPATFHAYAADESIDPTAYRPQKVRVEPPVLPSDVPDQLKHAFGRSVDDRFPYVADDPLGAKCLVRRSAHARQRHQRCGPLQCPLDGGGVRDRTDRRK